MYTTAYAHVTALGVAGTRRTRAPRNVHRRGAPRNVIHFVTRIPLNRSVIGTYFRVFGAVCGLPGLDRFLRIRECVRVGFRNRIVLARPVQRFNTRCRTVLAVIHVYMPPSHGDER